jgi:D-arabinose 5-phosphate isomerase GutQ
MNDGEIGKYSTLHVKLSKNSEADTHNLLGMITQMETCIWLILISAVLPLCSIRSGGW